MTPKAALSIDDPNGWHSDINLIFGKREYVADKTELVEAELRMFSARIGYRPWTFIEPWIEAGAVQAEFPTEDGEYGLLYGAGVDVDMVEWVLEGNPSLRRQRLVTVDGRFAYRDLESNFAGRDMQWGEVSFNPGVTWSSNRMGQGEWHPRRPYETRYRASTVFSTVDGNFGDADLKQNRDFAFRLGGEMLWSNRLQAKVEGTWYGDKDRLLSFGIGYRFY